MSQPVLHQSKAWDATLDNDVSFSYSGNQVVKNQMIIKNNTTNATVYDNTVVSFQLKHKVPANTLVNGTCYNIQIRVFDSANIASAYSNKDIFYCLSAPLFRFSNCPPDNMIMNSTFDATLAYSQAQTEPLNNFQFILYNEQKNEISRSPLMFDSSKLHYIYTMLEDKHKYFFRAVGETLNYMPVDTGYVAVSVQYILPSFYTMVDLQNLYKEGMIRIRSNMVSITGTSNPSPPIYISNDEVDLTAQNSWVKFDSGYEINGNFTLQAKCRAIIKNGKPLILSDGNDTITITYMIGKFAGQLSEKGYLMLEASNTLTSYIQMSNYLDLPINDLDQLYLWIRREGCVYEIRVKKPQTLEVMA